MTNPSNSSSSRPLTEAEALAVYLTVAQVLAIIGVSYATLWRWQKGGHFPHRRKLGPNRVAFLRSEVEEWIESRPRVRDSDSEDSD